MNQSLLEGKPNKKTARFIYVIGIPPAYIQANVIASVILGMLIRVYIETSLPLYMNSGPSNLAPNKTKTSATD